MSYYNFVLDLMLSSWNILQLSSILIVSHHMLISCFSLYLSYLYLSYRLIVVVFIVYSMSLMTVLWLPVSIFMLCLDCRIFISSFFICRHTSLLRIGLIILCQCQKMQWFCLVRLSTCWGLTVCHIECIYWA